MIASIRIFTPVQFFIFALMAFVLAACDKPQQSSETPAPPPAESPPQEEAKAPEAPSMPNVQPAPASSRQRGMADLSAAAPLMYSAPPAPAYPPTRNRENYGDIDDNPVKQAAAEPVSTFSIDVDTGSYANIRRFLNQGDLPPMNAVRIEELINYFDYDYPVPESGEAPFSVSTDIARTPWNGDTYLLRIGIKGYEVPKQDRPPANLVFLMDVSGSMNAPNKLPLLKSSFRLLLDQLNEEDTVSIVVYAGAAGVVLDPTPAGEQAKILAAIEQLRAGGSTAGGEGIRLAYAKAQEAFVKDGINRILLATDGDFNVGVADVEALKDMVARKRKSGISLSVLGFGIGNYNEEMAEQLADVGNGNYSYIDTLKEARKVLVEQAGSTLQTIAKDTKIQIEFNPAIVAEYRLIGYSNRMLEREDFSNDKVDAGDIGAGHTVTALYEIARVGSDGLRLEPLRYQDTEAAANEYAQAEFAHLRLRYKQPDADESELIEIPLAKSMLDDPTPSSDDYRFAAAVAAFGENLRGGKYTGDFGFDEVVALARASRGDDPHGYRSEFLQLAELALSLDKTAVRNPENAPENEGG